jgi:ABC-type proline/glycine betaine transport system ATPase subunit
MEVPARTPFRALSRGQATKAMLIGAVAHDPELLLLDEPFASLDPGTRAELTDDFERLRRGTSTTCVLVTHDLDEAVRLGDELAVLLEGRIRQLDAPARVMHAPSDEDVAAFVGAPAGIRGRVLAARDGLVVIDTGAGRRADLSERAEALLRTAVEQPPGGASAHHDGDHAASSRDVAGTGPGGS